MPRGRQNEFAWPDICFFSPHSMNSGKINASTIKSVKKSNKWFVSKPFKTLIHDFHYNYIKEKYGDRSKLLFKDTDSLTHEVEDVYQDFWNKKRNIRQ